MEKIKRNGVNTLNCPICENKTKVKDSRTSMYFTTTRTYDCLECDITFKTQEKILFETIPAKIRSHFIETGINDYCEIHHSMMKEKGFHDEPKRFAEYVALMHSELSEALEADRVGNFENRKEELADVCLRIFDFCGLMGIDLESEIEKKMEYNRTREYKHGKRY